MATLTIFLCTPVFNLTTSNRFFCIFALFKGTATMHDHASACNNVLRLVAASLFTIFISTFACDKASTDLGENNAKLANQYATLLSDFIDLGIDLEPSVPASELLATTLFRRSESCCIFQHHITVY